MGFFDFLKPKKNALLEMATQTVTKIFPKGEKDKDAVTDELLHILNNKIARDETRKIAIRSVIRSRMSEEFSKEELKQHLAGYCLHHFNDKEIEKFHSYLAVLIIADMMSRTPPSGLIRDSNGKGWHW